MRSQRRHLLVILGLVVGFGLAATVLLFLGQRNDSPILSLIGIHHHHHQCRDRPGWARRATCAPAATLRGRRVATVSGVVSHTIRVSGRVATYVLRLDGQEIIVSKPVFSLSRTPGLCTACTAHPPRKPCSRSEPRLGASRSRSARRWSFRRPPADVSYPQIGGALWKGNTMTVDRSMRNALAAILLVAALLVAMNQVVARATMADWWLPVLLFVLGAGLTFAPSLSRRQPDEDEEAVPSESSVRTYLVTAPPAPQLLAATAAEAADAEPLPFAEATVSAASGSDDLTKINGIGRKSADALKAAGIDSFQKLASANDESLRAAITSAGVRLVGDVDTWAKQAAYAARGDWDGLSQFNAGRRTSTGD
ncbi:MAG: helix-hairpin-helix domain-containing protein [Anaerolineae bacterium]